MSARIRLLAVAAVGLVLGSAGTLGFQAVFSGPYEAVDCTHLLDKSPSTCAPVTFPEKPQRWESLPNCTSDGLPPGDFSRCRL